MHKTKVTINETNSRVLVTSSLVVICCIHKERQINLENHAGKFDVLQPKAETKEKESGIPYP